MKRTALDEALAEKHGARQGKSQSVGALAAARDRSLHVYNVMGKRLGYVALADIGRLDEYPRYFLDLQVHEDGPRTQPGNEPAAE